MKTRLFRLWLGLFVSGLLASCSSSFDRQAQTIDAFAPIVPDYADSIVIPANIAPLNFCFSEEIKDFVRAQVRFCAYDSLQVLKKSCVFKVKRVGGTRIGLRQWRRLLAAAAGGHLSVEMATETHVGTVRYKPLHWFVSPDKIDRHLLYRVSQYEEGEHGEVYFTQRDLENFKNRYIGHNRLLDYDNPGNHSCMNCHDCLDNDSRSMVFHVRGVHKGTILMRGDTLLKIAVPDSYNLRLTYPAWHPSGKYVAFSTNLPTSVHYASSTHKIIYTLDTLGSIVLLDVERMLLFSCPELTDTAYDQVFPAWSPDGTRLYFCRSPKKDYGVFPFPQYIDSSLSMRQNRTEQIWDDLMQMDFDPQAGVFSDLRCVYPFSQMRKSATMPKVSRDGRFLIVSLLQTSTFPLQNLGDFYRLDLNADTIRPVELSVLNTPGSEKGHSFSSGGQWMVFSSSRRTLAIPETYITHFDTRSGSFSKPFLVPQESGDFYRTNLQGFVFPVLSVHKTRYAPRKIAKTIRGQAILVGVDSSLSDFKLAPGQKASLRSGH
ncbi:MAG: hypothetical protein NC396_05935 [Bacteroides sp.]|nr:hypothetical protein [Bacteroides sp.]MCM1085895.1 hypothetical protein [Bacteroides sp.]